MDLDTLRSYIGYKKAIKALSEEIETLYSPISSISFQYYYKQSNKDWGGPTVRALNRIENRKRELTLMLNEYIEVSEEIENWLKTLNDPVGEAIIRYHFLLGRSWSATAVKIYGYDCAETVRIYVYRLLKKEEQKDREDEPMV